MMFDKARLQEAVALYKRDFEGKQWPNEKYKWEAVKCFQDNWDINASDFADMLERSLTKTYNLLASINNFPRAMIEGFARSAPQEVRDMFRALFDETTDVVARILTFKKQAEVMLKKYGEGAKSHYQSENAISVYLWLKYPDKYYIYKFGEIKRVFEKLNGDFHLKKGDYAENLRKFYSFYDALCMELKKDSQLQDLLKSHLTKDCYPDPELKTLTLDVGFYISRWLDGDKEPSEPEPSQLSDEEQRTVHYWLYSPGAGADKWDECYERGIMLLGWGELGNLERFENKESMRERMKSVYGGSSSYKNCAHATWQFVHDMKPGDVVFVKQGVHTIIGKGVVSSAYRYEERKDGFSNVREVEWTDKGNWEIQSQTLVKTLTDVTEYADFLQELQNALAEKTQNAAEEPDEYNSLYTKEDFLQDVYMTETEYNQLTSLLHRKKNVILQGAPGVGKTFIAKKLAYAMMGQKDEERVKLVQFHQSYSYEDFIMGYRPTETGFALHKGVFYEFCKKAEKDKDRDYFFIIDEINRGNLSKIFGELFMLLENDKRGEELQLLYSDEVFSIPKNLYVIGMMNTADRSLAMLDYALRRRFAFFTIQPGFETHGFHAYQTSLEQATFDRLIERVKALNEEIKEDASLGEGFRIGHSYFCNLTKETCSDGKLRAIIEYEIIPLLKEYWFDEPSKVETWMQNLRSVLP